MAITENSRRKMTDKLVATLGEEDAMSLVEHLPPVGWADVATTHDVAQLGERMDLQFTATQKDLAQLEERMDLQFTATQKDLAQLEERMDLRFAAAKKDLGHLETAIDAKFALVDERFTSLEHLISARIHESTQTMYRWFLGTLLGLAAILVSVAGIVLRG